MSDPIKQVREFHEAFGQEQADSPTAIDETTALSRSIWTGEELIEFLYASVGGDSEKFARICEDFQQGLTDATKKIIDKRPDVSDILVSQADALTDMMYFTYGTFAIAGIEPQPLFDIVQEANMGKLWEDGKPRYREDGKIMKPPIWEQHFAPEPKLKKEIERQSSAYFQHSRRNF